MFLTEPIVCLRSDWASAAQPVILRHARGFLWRGSASTQIDLPLESKWGISISHRIRPEDLRARPSHYLCNVPTRSKKINQTQTSGVIVVAPELRLKQGKWGLSYVKEMPNEVSTKKSSRNIRVFHWLVKITHFLDIIIFWLLVKPTAFLPFALERNYLVLMPVTSSCQTAPPPLPSFKHCSVIP